MLLTDDDRDGAAQGRGVPEGLAQEDRGAGAHVGREGAAGERVPGAEGDLLDAAAAVGLARDDDGGGLPQVGRGDVAAAERAGNEIARTPEQTNQPDWDAHPVFSSPFRPFSAKKNDGNRGIPGRQRQAPYSGRKPAGRTGGTAGNPSSGSIRFGDLR